MFHFIVMTVLKTVFAFLFLLVLTRLMGRKMIAQITFFDFVVAITLGSVTTNLALGTSKTSLGAGMVLIVFTLLIFIFDLMYIQSFRFRKWVNSEPIVLVENGKIVSENMRKLRFSLNDLLMKLRENNIFEISNVEFAILESDGKMSVLPKAQNQPVTPVDIQLHTPYKGLMKDIVIDGQVMKENLDAVHLDRTWLLQTLKQQNVSGPEKVFYAGLDTQGHLYVSLRSQKTEDPGQHGIE